MSVTVAVKVELHDHRDLIALAAPQGRTVANMAAEILADGIRARMMLRAQRAEATG
ncbi:hypothetical protein [Nocardia carnea]|uniref:hypothetical protein n=1 Tax=Nocardia carnea TaxID=37328 RepID=UPI0024589C5B|nr:hypothetical protein [Nocardia carnea]